MQDEEGSIVSPRRANLLSIPRELRSMIYRELLLVDRFGCLSTGKMSLHPAILQVCTLLYEEAKATLYGENCWIEISMDEYIQCNFHRAHEASQQLFPAPRLRKDYVFLQPTLKIKFEGSYLFEEELKEFRAVAVPSSRIVLPLAAMPRFCGMISNNRVLDESTTMCIDFSQSTRARWQDHLIFCLGEIHISTLEVNVAVFKLSSICEKVADSVTADLTHVDQVFDRMSAYRSRVKGESRLCEARNTCFDALDYFAWLFCNPEDSPIMRLDGYSTEIGISLLDNAMATTFEFADMCTMLGDFDCALQQIQQSFLHWLTSSTKCRYKADAHYWFALAQIGKGEVHMAIFHFLQALASRPGDQLYDAAVDMLEENLRGSTREEDVIALCNIKEVLQPFRHQVPGLP